MNRIFNIIFLLYSFSAISDPHYVQALHPYCIGCTNERGDNIFNEYLRSFDQPVNVDVRSYKGSLDPDSGTDWYIYIYIVNESATKHFALDISCLGTGMQIMSTTDRTGNYRKVAVEEGVTSIDEMIGTDPIRNNPPAYIHEGNVIWPLDSSDGAQGMWFYSMSAPTNRPYQLVNLEGKTIQKGTIKGPSCTKPFEQRVITLTDEERVVLNGSSPYADLRSTEFDVAWHKNKDGYYVYSYDITSSNNNLGDIDRINIDISCEGLSMDSYGYRYKSSGRKNKIHYQYGYSDSGSMKDYLKRRINKSIDWWTEIKPGEQLKGLQIISTEPPVARNFTISPSFDKGYIIPHGIPYSDYQLTGMIEGPGCPSDAHKGSDSLASPLTFEKQRKEQERIQKRQRVRSDGPVICVGIQCLQ